MSRILVIFDKNSNKVRVETQKLEIDSSIEENQEVKAITKDFLGEKINIVVNFLFSREKRFYTSSSLLINMPSANPSCPSANLL